VNEVRGFGNIIYGAIGLAIFVIMITSIVMPTIAGVNHSLWPPTTVVMWGILPIVVVASVIMFVIGKR
jgi:hypothetical protein